MPVLRRVGRYALLYGTAIIILLPFVWIVLSAFKPESELVRYPPTLLPREWTLDNFIGFFSATQFQRAMLNSFILALTTTLLAMVVAAPAAYALSRFNHRVFEVVARLFVYTYMIPGILLVVPVYKIFFELGLSNTLHGLAIIYLALVMPLMLWTLRSFFAGIPVDL